MTAIVSDFRRELRCTAGEARAVLLRALDELGFAVAVSQLTRIEAHRGSKLGAAMLNPRKMPTRIVIDVVPREIGCELAVHLEDGLDSPIGRSYGVNGAYERVFREAQERIDAGLARLAGGAGATSFAPPTFASTTPTLGLVERANAAVGHGEAAVAAKVGGLLEGSAGPTTPRAWKGVEQVWFVAADRRAVLSLAEAQAHLTIAAIVAAQPGTLPAHLAASLERFAGSVEQAMTQAPPGVVRIDVAADDRPVLEFMHTQVRIRDGLPVRTLHRCRDCRFEKITNPDYERLMERNRKLRSLASAAGATISSGGVRPFVVVGALFQLKHLDPDYTCPRCQAMEADESLATFCPTCGDLRKEAVLRTCPKCGHDFIAGLDREDPPFWAADVAGPAPAAPWPAPAPGSMAR